jgi:hypothetical protein
MKYLLRLLTALFFSVGGAQAQWTYSGANMPNGIGAVTIMGLDNTNAIVPLKINSSGQLIVTGGGGGGGGGGSITPFDPQSFRLSDGTNWQQAALDRTTAAAPFAFRLSDGTNFITTLPVSIASSVAVTGTFWQATQPISAASLPLPADAATQTTLAALNAKIPAVGPASDAASLPVVLSFKETIGPFTAQSTGNNLLTADGSWFDAQGDNSFSVQIIASAGISAGQIIFEQTNDTTNAPNGVTLAVDEQGVINANPITAALSIAASTNRMFKGAITGRYIRVRISTAFVGGTVRAVGAFSPLSYAGVTLNVQQATAASLAVTASLAATQTLSTVTTLTGGSVAEDSATTTSPHIVGAIARTALPAATVVAGDAVRNTSSVSGQLIMKPFAVRELDFFANVTVTTATQTAIRAAQAAGIRQNVTSITYQNTNAVTTTLTIQDGNTTLIQVSVPASMTAPVQLQFPTPLFGTAATALNYTAGTTAANILLNVTGFNSY